VVGGHCIDEEFGARFTPSNQLPQHMSRGYFIRSDTQFCTSAEDFLSLPDCNLHVEHVSATLSTNEENRRPANGWGSFDCCSLSAFCGAATIGHVTNAFKFLSRATPFLVKQILPMELLI